MVNRQLYTYKFKSSRLKAFGYVIETTFAESKELGEIIALSDSQVLRSIRDIRGKTIDYDKIEKLYSVRDEIRDKVIKNRQKEEDSLKDTLKKTQDEIYQTLFVPDYITVIIEHPKHYDYIFRNGIIINGCKYERQSCAAGQSRKSTIVLCNSETTGELERRLNNGRNLEKPMVPNKFNAYYGLYSSATYLVSEPKFIVVKDFCNSSTFMANYVKPTANEIDDIVDVEEVTVKMNRSDGMGLISPKQAQIWAEELGLDYLPSQFGIRQSFLKGMLCVFDIHDFCEKVNGGNTLVETIYKDDNGNPIMADLKDYDVIITESQFKLWDSYDSIEHYITNSRKNKLYWGVTQFSPKSDKNVLRLNYQFIQTLNLNQEAVEKMSEMFVEWINNVSYDNVAYMLLFLLGVNNDEDSIRKFLHSSKNYWVMSKHIDNSRRVTRNARGR